MTDPPGGWLHESHLVETHKLSIPTDSVADDQAAREVCRMWATRWLEAHEIDADLGYWTSAQEGRTGVVWSITVGRAASTVPGAGQPSDWTWSARAKEWARSLHRAFSPVRVVHTTGRIGRTTDEDGAEVVKLFGAEYPAEAHGDNPLMRGDEEIPEGLPVEPGLYGIPHPSPYTLDSVPVRVPVRFGPPTGYFRITGGGLPPGGVEGQADPRTGPSAEDIHEALKRGDVMANPLASEDVADQRPPWLRRLDGWDEDEIPAPEPVNDALRREVERQMTAHTTAIEADLRAMVNATDAPTAKRAADSAEARLRRQAALLGVDPNSVHSRSSIQLNRPRCGECYQPIDPDRPRAGHWDICSRAPKETE